MKPRLTAAVRRGLWVLHGLVLADVEAEVSSDDSGQRKYGRWSKAQYDEICRALDYLEAIARPK